MTALLRPWTHADAPALSTPYRANSDLHLQFSDVVPPTLSVPASTSRNTSRRPATLGIGRSSLTVQWSEMLGYRPSNGVMAPPGRTIGLSGKPAATGMPHVPSPRSRPKHSSTVCSAWNLDIGSTIRRHAKLLPTPDSTPKEFSVRSCSMETNDSMWKRTRDYVVIQLRNSNFSGLLVRGPLHSRCE